jgi:hypothetical protein
MEPLAALSLAAGIVQFVDFSTKLIHGAKEIHQSTSGMTEDNRSLESAVNEMRSLSLRLDPPITGEQGEDEKALRRLAAECRILSHQIHDLLKSITPEDPNSRRQSFISSLKSVWKDKEKQELERRLNSCRSQLELQLSFMMRSDTMSLLEGIRQDAEAQMDLLSILRTHTEQLRSGTTVTSISPEAQQQFKIIFEFSEAALTEIASRQILKSLWLPELEDRFDAVEEAHYDTFKWLFSSDSSDSTSTDSDQNIHTRHEERRTQAPKHDDHDFLDNRLEDDSGIADGALGLENESRMQPLGQHRFGNNERSVVWQIDDGYQEEVNYIDLSEGDAIITSQNFTSTVYNTEHAQIQQAGKLFRSWLSSGQGIFHIAGKLGSGKSTFMKYVTYHPCTLNALGTPNALRNWSSKQPTGMSHSSFGVLLTL